MTNLTVNEILTINKILKRIPRNIQDEYNMLASGLQDGGVHPDCIEIENDIDKLRKEYPHIKVNYTY